MKIKHPAAVLFAVLFLLCALSLLVTAPLKLFASAEEDGADGGTVSGSITIDTTYWFQRIDVDIEVRKDKTFAVTEKLKVGFLYDGRNTGIIRDIQRISQTTRVIDGKQKTGQMYLARLSHVAVTIDGEPARVTQGYYRDGNFFSVKMQKQDESYFDATDQRNNTGYHDFVLSYVYDMSEDKAKGYDDFTFDVLGYAMAFTRTFTANITFPEGCDLSQTTFRTNRKAAWTPDGMGESVRIEDNTISLTAHPHSDNKGYTVQVLLPDGYFETAGRTHFWYYWLFFIASVGSMVAGLYFAIKYLPRKTVEPVEVVPPQGMKLMRVSALWNGEALEKDAPAVILDWAAKGYVSLEQDGKRHVILHKLNDCPLSATNGEYKYFKALFTDEKKKECDVFSTKALRRSHTRAADAKKRKLYRAVTDMKTEGDIPDPVKEGAHKAVVLLCVFSLLPVLFMLIYDAILQMSALAIFFFIFFAAGTAVNYINKLHAFQPLFLVFLISFPAPAVGKLLFASFMLYDYAFLYVISVIWWFAAYLLHFFMLRRSDEAALLLGRLKGFKRFLLKAELSRIRLLFDENPAWFSEILPYCFVMGISKKVEKRYSALGIPAPEWLNGCSVSSIGHCVSHGIGSVGGGGSSGGGGGGGGGSSGGGGGGGGSRGC